MPAIKYVIIYVTVIRFVFRLGCNISYPEQVCQMPVKIGNILF